MLLLGGAEVPRWPPEQGVAHDVGGNAAVALELGGLCVVVPPQQRGVGDDDADVQARAEARLFRAAPLDRSEEHTSELQSRFDLVCRLLLEKKKNKTKRVANKT